MKTRYLLLYLGRKMSDQSTPVDATVAFTSCRTSIEVTGRRPKNASMEARMGRTAKWAARSIVAVVCVVALVSGCGSGAVSGPVWNDDTDNPASGLSSEQDGDNTSTSPPPVADDEDTSAGSAAEGGGQGGREYTFGLPVGDTSVNTPAGQVYLPLAFGECDLAQRWLDYNLKSGLTGENAALLLEAGIALCHGDVGAATRAFDATSSPGSESWFLCELYRVAGSVIRQEPKESLGTCPPPPPLQGEYTLEEPPTEGPPPEESPTEEPLPEESPSDQSEEPSAGVDG